MEERLLKGEIHRFKNAADDTVGMDASIVVENGNIIVDFTRPVELVGMNVSEAKALVVGLVQAIAHIELIDPPIVKANLN